MTPDRGPAWSLPPEGVVDIEAMVLSGNALFVSGPTEAAGPGPNPGELWVVSRETGKKLAVHKLAAAAVAEVIALAGGRLFLATQNGEVLCFGKKQP